MRAAVACVLMALVAAAAARPHHAHADAHGHAEHPARVAAAAPPSGEGKPMIGAYVLVTQGRGVVQEAGFQQFSNLARLADQIPLTRVWLSFLDPSLVYVPGSNTLANTGLNLTSEADLGFAALKQTITEMQTKGVEVFLSMGGARSPRAATPPLLGMGGAHSRGGASHVPWQAGTSTASRTRTCSTA